MATHRKREAQRSGKKPAPRLSRRSRRARAGEELLQPLPRRTSHDRGRIKDFRKPKKTGIRSPPSPSAPRSCTKWRCVKASTEGNEFSRGI